MTSRIRSAIIEESTTRYSPWRIGTSSSAKKRLDPRWKAEQDSIEAWMRLLIAKRRKQAEDLKYMMSEKTR